LQAVSIVRIAAIISLRTLLFLAGAAVAAAITYAVMVDGDSSAPDDEDGASVRHTIRGDSSEFALREDGLVIKANWRGKLKLAKSGDAIAYVEDFLALEIEEDGLRESLRLEKDGRSVSAAYWRDGNEQEPGAETDAHVDALIMRFLRASGFEAEMRVDKILEAGGVEAVLLEIDALSSDYAIRKYVAALSKRESLNADQTARLIDKLMRLKGDHDIARALFSIAESQDISDETMIALLTVAEEIDSDYEKRRVLTAIAARPFSAGAADQTLALLSTIKSDHDIRVSTEALLTQKEFHEAHGARLIKTAAAGIESDHDLRLILTQTTARLDDPAIADVWFEAIEAIDSDYDKRIAIEAAAGVAGENEALKARLRSAAQTISSEHDRERALKALK